MGEAAFVPFSPLGKVKPGIDGCSLADVLGLMGAASTAESSAIPSLVSQPLQASALELDAGKRWRASGERSYGGGVLTNHRPFYFCYRAVAYNCCDCTTDGLGAADGFDLTAEVESGLLCVFDRMAVGVRRQALYAEAKHGGVRDMDETMAHNIARKRKYRQAAEHEL